MATKIVTKNSSTASAVPTASDLVQGELAVNVADKRLFTEDNAGAIVELGTNPSGNVTFQDNGKAIFGAGSDLQIYHDGSNSRIVDAGTGIMTIQASSQLGIYNADGTQVSAEFVNDGKVGLRFSGSEKLVTTATGIDVTGTATMDGLTVDGSGTIASFKRDAGVNGQLDLSFPAQVATLNASSSFAFQTAATERMRLTSTGLGIGTSSPSRKLDVNGSGIVRGFLTTYGAGVNNALFLNNTAYEWAAYTNASNNFEITDWNLAQTRLTIDTSGNVGIGLTNPSDYYANDLVVAAGAEGGITIKSSTSDHAYLMFADGTSGSDAYRGYLGHNHSTDATSLVSFGTIGLSSVAETTFTTNSAERMRIDSAGNVGIGSTSASGSRLRLDNGGTSGAPQLMLTATGASTQTEIRHDTSNNLIFENWNSGRTERMRIDSAGRVGIGTSSFVNSNARFVVSNGTVDIEHYTDTGFGVGYVGTRTNHDFGLLTNGTPKLYITTAGNVGIGTSSPTNVSGYTTLNVGAGSIGSIIKIDGSTAGHYHRILNNNGQLYIQADQGNTTGSSAIVFGVDGSERMRISSAGALLVGGTVEGPGAQQGIALSGQATDSNIYVRHANGTGSGSFYMAFTYNTSTLGSISQNGTSQVLYNISSDQRLKENIADADDAGSKIDAIQVRQYDWKADGAHQDYGMIAQELQAVAPEAVSGDADSEEMMGVDYSKLVPMLIKEIQSLRNRVAQLEE